jgi:hypothetical protein
MLMLAANIVNKQPPALKNGGPLPWGLGTGVTASYKTLRMLSDLDGFFETRLGKWNGTMWTGFILPQDTHQ